MAGIEGEDRAGAQAPAADGGGAVVRLETASKTFGALRALDRVDLAIRPG